METTSHDVKEVRIILEMQLNSVIKAHVNMQSGSVLCFTHILQNRGCTCLFYGSRCGGESETHGKK